MKIRSRDEARKFSTSLFNDSIELSKITVIIMEHSKLAEYCKATYDGCFEHIDHCDHSINVGNIRAYYYDLEKLLIIVGSDDLRDWMRNINCRPIAGEHSGFHAMSIELYKYLYKNEIFPRTITGHSMGGAIGSLMIKYLSSIEEVVTFGCPNYYSHFWNGEVATHYVLPLDIIAHVPLGYYKCGKEIKLPQYKMCPFKAHHIETYIEAVKEYEEKVRDAG